MTERHSQETRYPNMYLNPVLSECEAGVLNTRHQIHASAEGHFPNHRELNIENFTG
jgi:hypothetical protein